jgi:small conductance mechanosensitive channel
MEVAMWQFFSTHSVSIFIAAALVLTVLLFVRDNVKSMIISMAPEALQERVKKKANIAFWSMEGILFLIVTAALVALVLSTEGIAARITPETVQEWFLDYGTGIIVTLLLGLGLWYVWKRSLPLFLHRYMARPKRGESREGMKRREDTLRGVFMGAGKIIIIILVAFMILSELNIPVGPILAGFGIVGIAVGFGAQYLIRDLIAGIFILMENQYRVGDVARVADIAGLVEEVNLRKTVLRDLDGIVHHVPNGEIKVASNYSRHFARVNLDISVAYGTNLDRAISVINQVCNEMAADENWRDRIRTVPQVLRVNNLGNSGIDIKILGEVKPLEQWATMGELRLRLKKAFDEEGIEIPWPHTKVYFGNAPGDESDKSLE